MTAINHAELGNVQILTARDTDSTYGSEERGFYLVGFIAGVSATTHLAWVFIPNVVYRACNSRLESGLLTATVSAPTDSTRITSPWTADERQTETM